MADARPVYELVNGPDPCDICTGLAGLYPTPPKVPIHFKCACTVHMVDPEDPDGTSYEVRNVQWDEARWTEEIAGTLDNCGKPELAASLALSDELVEPVESFDPGVQEAAEEAGWQKPQAQTVTAEVQMDANTELEFKAALTYVSIVFKGELWRVHVTAGEDGGMLQEEQLIDSVGGLYEALVAVELRDYEVRVCADGAGEDSFQDNQESPWLEDDPREIET